MNEGTVEDWFRGGERAALVLRATAEAPERRHTIFHRVEGEGPWVTMLHGFPTCSWDWAKVAPALRGGHRLLVPDFLGFGDSDKPKAHTYSLFEQADIVEALWRRHSVAETALVAHDYGASVALELLARRSQGRLATRLGPTALLNAGLYLDVYRPLLIQSLLRSRWVGPIVGRAISEHVFQRSFRSIFADGREPPARDLHQHWLAISRRDGHRRYHRLIRYIDERHQHRGRWESVLAAGDSDLWFVWGLRDPISGTPMAEAIRRRVPGARLVELPEAGHYPHIEEPNTVIRALGEALARFALAHSLLQHPASRSPRGGAASSVTNSPASASNPLSNRNKE